MKILKRILAIVLSLVLITSPITLTLGFVLFTPSQYDESFVGILNEKYDLLHETEGEKIVVVGGSSVAFGLDSYTLEKYTGKPVVNFGLYAALGTKLMLDLSLDGISDGDVVILSPEIDQQTLSLYFNADATLKAMDGSFYMMRDIRAKNWPSMLGSMWSFAKDKYKAMANGGWKNTDGEIYLSKYFNERGDFALYERKENVMPTYYDTNTLIKLDSSAYGSDFEEFCEYLNDYIAKCKRRGATVLFAYAPMNEMALQPGATEESNAAFDAWLRGKIDCEFLGEIDRSIIEAGYFFDTNFHLNDAGAKMRTLRMVEDLKFVGVASGIVEDAPEAPALPPPSIEFDGYDENSKYFTYTLMENGAYAISGVSEEGKSKKELTIPLGYDGLKVMSVYPHAFKDSSIEALIVTHDSNLIRFENEAFIGASSLKNLWIYKTSGDFIAPPADFMGVNSAFLVHVPENTNFDTHYYWGDRKLTFVFDAN